MSEKSEVKSEDEAVDPDESVGASVSCRCLHRQSREPTHHSGDSELLLSHIASGTPHVPSPWLLLDVNTTRPQFLCNAKSSCRVNYLESTFTR